MDQRREAAEKNRRQATPEEVRWFLGQTIVILRRYPRLLEKHPKILPHHSYFVSEGPSLKVIKAVCTVERFNSNRHQFFDQWEVEFLLWLFKQRDCRLLESTLGQAFKHCHFK